MLRSIQTLRNTSSDAQILVADDDQLALVGGDDNYYMPWHWHDCLMVPLPRAGSVDFWDEEAVRPFFTQVPKADLAWLTLPFPRQSEDRREWHAEDYKFLEEVSRSP
jgi:hypothetical protein